MAFVFDRQALCLFFAAISFLILLSFLYGGAKSYYTFIRRRQYPNRRSLFPCFRNRKATRQLFKVAYSAGQDPWHSDTRLPAAIHLPGSTGRSKEPFVLIIPRRFGVMLSHMGRSQHRVWLRTVVLILLIMSFYRTLIIWSGLQQHLSAIPAAVKFPEGIAVVMGIPSAQHEPADQDTMQKAPTSSPPMLQFWGELLNAMMDAKPQSAAIVRLEDKAKEYDMQPNPDIDSTRPPLDIALISNELRDALKTAHTKMLGAAPALGARMVEATRTLGDTSSEKAHLADLKAKGKATKRGIRTISYAPTRGIAMASGRRHFGMVLASLLMLRRTGSQLPVQVFLDSSRDYEEGFCEETLLSLGAECYILDQFWASTPEMPSVTGFQTKILAIILSKFTQVLFLDADCFPIYNPDDLFTSEPFKSTGLLTWPDFWLNTASPLVYDIMGISPPALTDRTSSESSILIYDKETHGTDLVMAAYYNFYGPDLYYPLLSQGAAGQGDKETFLHAALVTGSPFYDVRTPASILGRLVNGSFIAAALMQADPSADFELWQEQEMKDRKTKGKKPPKKSAIQPIHARAFFIHQNQIKLDIFHLPETMTRAYLSDKDRGLTRMWDDKEFRETAGYDVERVLWEEILQSQCAGVHETTPDCLDLQHYFTTAVLGDP